MVAELQERIKENEIPIESKMEEVKRKVIARSKFAGEKCVCTIFESKNDQGERIVAAKVFKVGKVVKRFDEKLVTLGLIAGEQRVEDVPMSITEFDEWKEWDAYQDQELVNYRFLGSEKYKILKANLSSASFDKLIGEFAGEAGVNVLASPLLRERLQISRSQGTKLDEIFREGELEVQNLTDQWHDMIKADVARTRLEDFIRNSVKWRLEIQDRLLKVLTKKQLAEVNTWYAASKQFPDPLFMIPSDYGEGGEGYYERQELMMDMFRTLEKSKKNTKPAPALSPAIPWNYHGVRWFE